MYHGKSFRQHVSFSIRQNQDNFLVYGQDCKTTGSVDRQKKKKYHLILRVRIFFKSFA